MYLLAACGRTAIAVLATLLTGLAWGQSDCKKPVYLTLDTGHMEVAPYIADTLRKHQVKVTFFAAHERTQTGDGSLGEHWAPWWRERGKEGHSFASHTLDHVVWRADRTSGADGAQFLGQPSAGSQSGRKMDYSAAQYWPVAWPGVPAFLCSATALSRPIVFCCRCPTWPCGCCAAITWRKCFGFTCYTTHYRIYSSPNALAHIFINKL